MILAGDVGGTKTTLALFDDRAQGLTPVREASMASRGHPRFDDLVRRFLADGSPTTIDVACFGVAGPVVDGRADATNLPWHLDEGELAERVPAGRVRLLNDLEATGRGVLGLPPEALATLQPGRAQRGNMAIIAPGH